MTLLSFHNDQKVKDYYLQRVAAHEAADEIVQGKYWENGKGCAVGCTLHSNQHRAYETELGLPEWLARLEDTLFESMSFEDAKGFPKRFLESIPVGVDLEPVRLMYMRDLMVHPEFGVLQYAGDFEDVRAAIEQVAALYERAIGGDEPTLDEWSSAASAAWRAARAAESAARAASAAESAARAAESAASAAWAARAAWSAARAAERRGRYKQLADYLLELLGGAV